MWSGVVGGVSAKLGINLTVHFIRNKSGEKLFVDYPALVLLQKSWEKLRRDFKNADWDVVEELGKKLELLMGF